ncbi:MAG: hypothetical protein ACRDNW_15555 [Trebonia sp.]
MRTVTGAGAPLVSDDHLAQEKRTNQRKQPAQSASCLTAAGSEHVSRVDGQANVPVGLLQMVFALAARLVIMRFVRGERLSVLWLCGPPGAGKSAAGWALYTGLARSGTQAGFADIDQLGMCVPSPPDDLHRYRLKERNLSAMAGNLRAACCGAVVVAGDLGTAPGFSSRTMGVARRTAAVPDVAPCRAGFRGMSPAPADDPDGHRLKASNLADIWRTYRAAGAGCLVLSGPVPDERAAAVYAEDTPSRKAPPADRGSCAANIAVDDPRSPQRRS